MDDGSGTQGITKIYTGSSYVNTPFVETDGSENNVWNEIVYQVGVGVNDNGQNEKVSQFALSQNYPNPFNPVTVISYQLSAFSDVKLVVFDLLGREVATLINENKPAGEYQVNFNASDLPSGIYFYTLSAGNYSETKKMTVIK